MGDVLRTSHFKILSICSSVLFPGRNFLDKSAFRYFSTKKFANFDSRSHLSHLHTRAFDIGTFSRLRYFDIGDFRFRDSDINSDISFEYKKQFDFDPHLLFCGSLSP
jgi:hypothetical protein